MGTFFFYGNRKPRKFNYTPILHDPVEEARKEKLQKRIQEIKREMGVLPEEKVAEKKEFKTEFISQTHHLKKRKAREASGQHTFFTNNGLLIIIVLILFAIFFFWVLR
jgi:hypothetical protein